MNPLLYPSLLIIPTVGSLATTLRDDQTNLYVIFGFVLCLILIMAFFRHQREKMWHETARLALEKGQPVPSRWGGAVGPGFAGRRGFAHFGYWGPWWEIRRGLVLLAVSAGLYYTLSERNHGWIAIPACIGTVYLVLGLISLIRGVPNEKDDPRDPPAQP